MSDDGMPLARTLEAIQPLLPAGTYFEMIVKFPDGSMEMHGNFPDNELIATLRLIADDLTGGKRPRERITLGRS